MAAHGDVNPCRPLYHEAIELIGRRWTGAILQVLLRGPHRFSEIGHAVPELSDRLLSERIKELEARGIVVRREEPGPPARVTYALSPMGAELGPPVASRAMADAPRTADDVIAQVEEQGIRFIRLWFTDILGRLKSFSINAAELRDAFEGGMGFDGSSITGFNPIEESDM